MRDRCVLVGGRENWNRDSGITSLPLPLFSSSNALECMGRRRRWPVKDPGFARSWCFLKKNYILLYNAWAKLIENLGKAWDNRSQICLRLAVWQILCFPTVFFLRPISPWILPFNYWIHLPLPASTSHTRSRILLILFMLRGRRYAPSICGGERHCLACQKQWAKEKPKNIFF